MAESKAGGVAKSVPTFALDPRVIEVEEGFNGRPIDLDHVQSIKTARRNGTQMPPVMVSVENGKVIMRDGHHRLYDIMGDIAEGIDIKTIQAIEFKGNDIDREFLMLNSQEGLKMTPLQLGIRYKLLVSAHGYTPKQIAERRGKSVQHVIDMIELANAPNVVQAMVTAGQVAGAVARKVVKEHGANAASVLADGITAAQAAGKTKMTPKHLAKPPKPPKPAKVVADDKLGDSYVKAVVQREQMTKVHLASMIESPSVNPTVRVAVKLVLDTMGGKKVEATEPTKLETGLYWLQELAANKSASEGVRAGARWFHDALKQGQFVKGTAPVAPSIMPLHEAIENEMATDGSVMAETLCPEFAKLIVYLRNGKVS